MLAQLGYVRFELLEGFTAFDESHKAHFAEHAVLQGKPRLQVMGEELTRLNFSLRLHWKLGNPDSAYQALLNAKSAQEPLDLILGSGRRVGRFVITSLTSAVLEQNAQGKTAARELSVDLLEYAEAHKNDLNLLGVISDGQSPLTALLPESVAVSVSGALAAAQKGVAIYREVRQVVNQTQDVVHQARELKNDPAGLLNLLGDMSQSISRLNLDFVLPDGSKEVQKMMDSAANVFHQLGDIGASFQAAHEDNALSVLDAAIKTIESVNEWLNAGDQHFQAALSEIAQRKE